MKNPAVAQKILSIFSCPALDLFALAGPTVLLDRQARPRGFVDGCATLKVGLQPLFYDNNAGATSISEGVPVSDDDGVDNPLMTTGPVANRVDVPIHRAALSPSNEQHNANGCHLRLARQVENYGMACIG